MHPKSAAENAANRGDVISPPFALTRAKDYGNKQEHEYVDWFLSFVEPFKRVLKPTGSIVIDVGGAYLPGRAQRSTYHFQLVVALANAGLQLCQEFYWYNPAKLPSSTSLGLLSGSVQKTATPNAAYQCD